MLLAGVAQGRAMAVSDGYVEQAFNGLAAYVLPGDDAYSVRQRRVRPGPGGVAAGTAAHLTSCFGYALAVAVNSSYGVNLPGPPLLAAVIDVASRARYPQAPSGPFEHPFANLTHARKARVMADIDENEALRRLPVGFAFNTILTLTALGCFSEYGVYDRRRRVLTGTPVGWVISRHSGVSDGWPELAGYWAGRRSVSDRSDGEAGGRA